MVTKKTIALALCVTRPPDLILRLARRPPELIPMPINNPTAAAEVPESSVESSKVPVN